MASCYNVTSVRSTGKASLRDPDHDGDAKIIDIKRAITDRAATKADATAKVEAVRNFTSWKLDWMLGVRCHPLVASTDVRVAETVAHHIDQKSRQARLHIETIGDEINKSERTVLRSLANLRALGLLDWKRRANKSSVFWLLDDKIETITVRRNRLREIRNERKKDNA